MGASSEAVRTSYSILGKKIRSMQSRYLKIMNISPNFPECWPWWSSWYVTASGCWFIFLVLFHFRSSLCVLFQCAHRISHLHFLTLNNVVFGKGFPFPVLPILLHCSFSFGLKSELDQECISVDLASNANSSSASLDSPESTGAGSTG